MHYGATKRVMYIAETLEYGIWYSKTSNFILFGNTDRDRASSIDDRRNVLANVFTLRSGVVTRSPKKQPTLALSTSEVEYVATTSVACQTIWLRRVLANLQQEQKEAIEIFYVNKATISIIKNTTFHSRINL